MRIIDAHVHLTDRICGYGPNGETRPIGGGKVRWPDGEQMHLIPAEYGDKEFLCETHLKLMDESGIEKAVLLQAGPYGYTNEYYAEVAARYPDRYIPAGGFDPCFGRSEAVLDSLINKMGFRIFKFELSTAHGISGCHCSMMLDEPRMRKAFARIADVDATLVMDIGHPTMSSYQVDAVRRIARDYPSMRIVICHLLMGGGLQIDQWRRDLASLVRDNVWFDLAALPPNMNDTDYPYIATQKLVSLAREEVGAERLIWGSDAPSMLLNGSYTQAFDYLMKSGIFTEDEQQDVFYNNAVRAYAL